MEPSYNSGQMNSGVRPGMIVGGANTQMPAPLPLSQKSKKSRKGLIIGLILLVVALIVAVVVIVLMQTPKNTNTSDFESVDDYVLYGAGFPPTNVQKPLDSANNTEENSNYVDGDENEADVYVMDVDNLKVEGEYIYAIEIADDASAYVSSVYYDILREKIGKFDSDSSLALKKYVDDLKILINAMDRSEILKGYLSAYDTGGKKAAKDYFKNNIECDIDTELGEICNSEKLYYQANLDKHKIFTEAGCLSASVWDYDCARKYYGETALNEKIDTIYNVDADERFLASSESKEKLSEEILKASQAVRREMGIK